MQINSHLSVLVHDLAKKWGDKPALTFRKFGSDQWQTVSFNQFSLRVKQVSNALLNLGAKPQDKIAVFSQNCVHYLYTDFGAYGIRVTSVPFYANSSEQQIQYMINDAQIRFLFVGEQEQYDKAHRIFALCPSLERIIIFDSSVRISTHDPAALYFKDFLKLGENLPRQTEVEELYKQASMDDLANILYTSGTTGDSKGVMLTYSQYYAALKANNECIPVTGIDLEHAVHRIFLLAKHILQLQVFDGLDSLAVIGIHLFLGHHFVLIEIEGELQFIGIKAHGLIAIEPFLDALHLLHLFLRILWVFPKVRSLGAELLLLEFYFLLVDIEIMMESIGSVHHIFQLVSCNH
jgi:long-subunit acyl-CoA synthetase (AMP-forming)